MNRTRPARPLGFVPNFEEWPGKGSPQAFVVSKNLHRRHLTISQRQMVAAHMATMEQGSRTDLEPSADSQKVSVSEAAKLLNVGERGVHHAIGSANLQTLKFTTAEIAMSAPFQGLRRGHYGVVVVA